MSCNRKHSHRATCSTHVLLVSRSLAFPAAKPSRFARKMQASMQSFLNSTLVFVISYSTFLLSEILFQPSTEKTRAVRSLVPRHEQPLLLTRMTDSYRR